MGDDVPPDSSFSQTSSIEKLVLQPTETYRLNLEDLYRGQNLDFTWQVTYSDTGLPVPNNISPKDNPLVQITPPYKETFSQNLFDQGSTDQMSLPQTTLIYLDQYQNRYMILIDYQMHLKIYDISDFYKDNIDPITPMDFDLYNTSLGWIHQDRACNNLIQLDDNLLFAVCKSNISASSAVGISVYITLGDLTVLKPSISLIYAFNGLNYDMMKDGELVLYGKAPVQVDNQVDQKYLVWVKENTTNCHFRLILLCRTIGTIEELAFIEEFEDPFIISKTDIAKSLTTQLPKRKAFQIDLRSTRPSGKLQASGFCQPEPIDFNAKKINYMQIRDIKMCPYYNGIVVASDFNYGLLFWSVDCSQPEYIDRQSPNYGCKVQSKFRLRQDNLGSIATLFNDYKGNSTDASDDTEKVMFALVTYPPKILEIDVSSAERPPFVSRIYKLGGTTEGTYYSMAIIEANLDYILTQLVEMSNQKPLIRVYHRKSELFSSVHTEIPLGDFYDSGLFVKFVIPTQNSFIVKSSNDFRIIKLQYKFLEFNVWNLTTAMILGKTYNPSGQVSLNFTLFAKNQSLHQIVTSFDLLVTDQDHVQTHSLLRYTNNTHEPIPIKYICGELSTEQTQIIDNYFSGKKNRLTLTHQNPQDQYFELSKVRTEQLAVQVLTEFTCPVNELVQFQSRKRESQQQILKFFLACAEKRSKRINFQEIEKDDLDPQEQEIPSFVLPDTNVLEFIYDSKFRNFYIVSDQAVTTNKPQTVLHLYRLYNIFNWELTVNFNKEVAMLKNFQLRQFDMVYFKSESQIGILISEEQDLPGNFIQQQILVFEMRMEATEIGFQPLRVRGVIQMTLQQPLFADDVSLRNARVDDDGYIWVLMSNGTLIVYDQVPLPAGQRDPEGNGMLNLHLINEFQRLDLINQKNSFIWRQNLNVINFSLRNSRLIVFTGDNQTQLHEYGATQKDLQKSMILPIYLSFEDSQDLKISMNYVISGKTQKVTYATFENYLIVLFQIKQSGIHAGYRFYIYNIEEPRHNALIMRINVTVDDPRIIDNNPLIIDHNFARVQLYRIDELSLGIILTIDNVTRAYYKFYPNTNLRLIQENIESLNQRCKEEDAFTVPITIFPSDNPQETVNFTIYGENKGLIITNQQKTQYITLQVQDHENKQQLNKINAAKYSLLQNFEGQQMKFNFVCYNDNPNRTKDPDQSEDFGDNPQLCKQLRMEQEPNSTDRNLEFLSTKNPAIGFFAIEPFLLFFDKQDARVYYMENSQSTSVPLVELFPYLKLSQMMPGVFPTIQQYRLIDIEFNETISGQYLITLNSYNQISASRVLAVRNESDLHKAEPLLATDQFHRFDSPLESKNTSFLVIQKAYNFTLAYSKIAHIEGYPINGGEKDYFGSVLVYDDPKQIDSSSRIEQYIFDLRDQKVDSKNVTIMRNLTFKSLYAERLNVATFKVTAIKVIKSKGLLLIGLLDVGLMLYDFDQHRVIKVVSVKRKLLLDTLMIIGIDPSTDNYFRLITRDSGVITVGYSSNSRNPYDEEPYLHESQGSKEFVTETSGTKHLYTLGKQGIAYLAVEHMDQTLHMRFYSKNVVNNSKALGSVLLEGIDFDQCNYMQTITYLPFIQTYLPSASDETMIVSLLCGSLLKFVQYNFYPSLMLNLQSLNDMEVSQNLVELYSANQRSTDSYQLVVTLLNQERGMDQWIYFMFIAVVGIILLSGQIRVKRQQQAILEGTDSGIPRDSMGQTQSTTLNDDSIKSTNMREQIRQAGLFNSYSSTMEDQPVITADDELRSESIRKKNSAQLKRISNQHQDYLMEELRQRSVDVEFSDTTPTSGNLTDGSGFQQTQ